MIVASAVMIIISVSILITTLINLYLMDLILERFKMEDKFDDSVTEHISNIYDLMKTNDKRK